MLLDGDQFLHRACAAVERDVRWDEENHVLHSNWTEAWEVVEGAINKTLRHFDEREYVLCLSDTDTLDFRKQIDPTYKSHRIGVRKPLAFADLKAKMKAELPTRSFPSLEADDVMGILATKPGEHERIIVSRDKDMKTIPARIYNGTDFISVSEQEADYNHLYQTLIGDASDGYKGCPGIGPKKAEKLLTNGSVTNGVFNPWRTVVAAFVNAGLTEEDALRQARLARILRWSDWDAEKKEPILWTPHKH
jgi:DNA polymerase-1